MDDTPLPRPAEVIAGVVVLLALAGSVLAWIRFSCNSARSWSDELSTTTRVPALVPFPAVLLAAAWLAMSMGDALFRLVGPEIPQGTLSLGHLHFAAALSASVIVALCLLLMTIPLNRYQWSTLGIPAQSLFQQLKQGAAGLLLSLMPVYAVLLATSFLRTEDSTHALLQLVMQSEDVRVILLTAFIAVVLAPLSEELIFRLILQGTLRRFMDPLPAILISSTVFAFVHGFPDSLGIFMLALVLGAMFERQRSLLAVVTTHMAFNFFNLVLALLSAAPAGSAP